MPQTTEGKRAAQKSWCKSNPEKRRKHKRAEYLRNRERYLETARERTFTLAYARRLLSVHVGIPKDAVTEEMAQAKLAHLILLREVRKARERRLLSQVSADYMSGATTYQLACKYGMDRERISTALRKHGITLKRRAFCKNGHEFTAANTAYTPEGWRRCRKCACEHTKRSYTKRGRNR